MLRNMDSGKGVFGLVSAEHNNARHYQSAGRVCSIARIVVSLIRILRALG